MQETRPFAWFDKRVEWFWDDMTQHELLLYFYLVTVGDMQTGCSCHSSREITRVLKIGPSSLIKARKRLVKRRVIAVSKDELSNRTIYQVLPLPILENDRIDIPRLVDLDAEKKAKSKKKKPIVSADDQQENNRRQLLKLQELLDID